MSYPHLSSPGRIGGVTLKNRIAMTAASASLSEPDGRMTEACWPITRRGPRAVWG